MQDLKQFLQQVNTDSFQTYVKKFRKERHYESNKWQRENPESQKECVKKYEKTIKGRYAVSKRTAKRNNYDSICNDISEEERIAIGKFYDNRPSGYHVDHIIPLSKGGKHCIANLQYLIAADNIRKKNKLDWKPDISDVIRTKGC